MLAGQAIWDNNATLMVPAKFYDTVSAGVPVKLRVGADGSLSAYLAIVASTQHSGRFRVGMTMNAVTNSGYVGLVHLRGKYTSPIQSGVTAGAAVMAISIDGTWSEAAFTSVNATGNFGTVWASGMILY